MNSKDYISSGILEAYVLGFATADEISEVEKLAKQFPEVQKEIDAICASLEAYASEYAVAPSKNLKASILARIEKEKSLREVPVISITKEGAVKRVVFTRWLAVASILLILSFSFYLFYSSSQSQVSENVSSEVTPARMILSALKEKHDMITVHLKAVKPVKNECIGCVVWDKTSKQVFLEVQNLPPLPEGQQYQLWALDEGKPIDAGLVADTKGVRKILKMKTVNDAQVFALTIEKEGGNPTPRGEMFATVSI